MKGHESRLFNKEFSLISVFLVTWLSLTLYILFYGRSTFLFWLLSLTAAVTLVLQINSFRESKKLNIIFVEIFLLFFSLQLVNVMYAGLDNVFGLDTYYELNAVQLIIDQGKWGPSGYYAVTTVHPYPAIHILAATVSEITGIRAINLAKWMGGLFYLLSLTFYFILGNLIFKNKKVTLLASLGFIFLWAYVDRSAFGRMSLSMLLFFAFFYIIVKDSYSSHNKYFLPSTIILAVVVFTHPVTRAVVVGFLFIFLLSYKLFFGKWKFIPKRLGVNICNVNATTIPKRTLITLAIATLLGIIIYFYFYPGNLTYLLRTILGHNPVYQYKPGFAISVPIQYKLFDYGQLAFLILFIVLIYKKKKTVKNFYPYVLILFALFLLVINVFIYFYLSPTLNLFRLFIFIWPMLLFPTAYAVQKTDKKKLLSFLIIGFIFVNMCGYHVFQYNRSRQPDYSRGEYDLKVSLCTQLAVMSQEYKGEIVGNHYFAMAFIGHKNKIVHEDLHFYLGDYKNEKKYSWFFLSEKDREHIFVRITGKNFIHEEVTERAYQNYQVRMDKTYSNGEAEIYKLHDI